MKRHSRVLSLLLCAALMAPALSMTAYPSKADAVSFNELNSRSVFLSQQEYDTCTLCANAMLLRRAAMLRGDSDWSSITEYSLRPYAWVEGVGMYYSYSYKGFNVQQKRFSGDVATELRSLLAQHPEGIVAYDVDHPHALLVTDYTDGKFYVGDPSSSVPRRIERTEATVDILRADVYWYVTNSLPSISTELKNNSTVDKTSMSLGSTATLKGAASDGNGGYTYTYEYKRSGASQWTSLGSGKSVSFRPSSAGYFNLRITAKDKSGNSLSKSFNLSVTDGTLANSSSVSQSSVVVGKAVTITGKASGGTGGYTYQYKYAKYGSTETTSLGSGSSASFKPKSAGTFVLYSTATDSSGKSITRSFNVTFYDPDIVNQTYLNTSKISVGERIIITGAATGGNSGYTYTYYYKRTGTTEWNYIGKGSVFAFQPSTRGVFDLKCTVKDSNGSTADRTFEVTASDGELKNLSYIKNASINLYDTSATFRIVGASSGGTGVYKYIYYYRKAGNTSWNRISGTDSINYFRPSEAGKYEIRITSFDKCMIEEKIITVTAKYDELKNTSSINKENITVGEKVVLNASAEGGNGGYKYEFQYKRIGSDSWTTFSNSTISVFCPSSRGVFEIMCIVTDKSGKSALKSYRVYASDGSFNNNAVVSSDEVKAGETIRVDGKDPGGTGVYYYEFSYKRVGAESWTSFGNTKNGVVRPSAPGRFMIRSVAIDVDGQKSERIDYVNVIS